MSGNNFGESINIYNQQFVNRYYYIAIITIKISRNNILHQIITYYYS